MPSKHVADAVDARLEAFWTATPVIAYDEIATPPDEDGFVFVQYPIVNGVRPVLGRLFWEEGWVRIVLSVKRGVGSDQGREWADTLANIFRSAKFDGIETRQPDGPLEDDSIDNGNWILYSIVVPYRFEFESAVFEFETV